MSLPTRPMCHDVTTFAGGVEPMRQDCVRMVPSRRQSGAAVGSRAQSHQSHQTPARRSCWKLALLMMVHFFDGITKFALVILVPITFCWAHHELGKCESQRHGIIWRGVAGSAGRQCGAHLTRLLLATRFDVALWRQSFPF